MDAVEPAALDSDRGITAVIGGRVENVDDLNRLLLPLDARRERLLCKLQELDALVYSFNSNRIRRDNGSDRPMPAASTPKLRHYSGPPPNQLGLNVLDTVLVDDDDDDDGSPVPSVVPVVEYDDPPPPSVLPTDGGAVRHTGRAFWAIRQPPQHFYF